MSSWPLPRAVELLEPSLPLPRAALPRSLLLLRGAQPRSPELCVPDEPKPAAREAEESLFSLESVLQHESLSARRTRSLPVVFPSDFVYSRLVMVSG